MYYSPQARPRRVVPPGAFKIAALGLDHGHIYGMCTGLVEAGAELKSVYDPDPQKVRAFVDAFPGVKPALGEAEILDDPEIRLVAAAALPRARAALGIRVMDHGKDYFTDKPPFTTLDQLAEVRQKVAQSGRKYGVYFNERIHVKSAVLAGQLIRAGAVGRVVQVLGLGPHRVSAFPRPDWFFHKGQTGGILCEIGTHQIEQFLYYTGSKDARVLSSKVGNYRWRQHPEFEDFGDATLVGDGGATQYFRVDWLTPDGLGSWSGDGRTFILGTDGYLELRRNIDITRSRERDHVFLVNHEGERYFHPQDEVGYPFFGEWIEDCLKRTEHALAMEHMFKAAQLGLVAERDAIRVDFDTQTPGFGER